MTHHKAVDSVRREENLRKRRTSSDELEARESEAPKVDEAVWSLVRRERVREALKGLPDPQREALALAYFGGYTQREIAGLTATPLGTVKTRMLAGMRRMKESLDGLSNAAGGLEPPGSWTPATDRRTSS
jgi:RNA polymerase sigma-70 factor (ECF subfamily)